MMKAKFVFREYTKGVRGLLFLLAMWLMPAETQAQNYIAINADNFPDATFRNWVLTTVKKDNEGNDCQKVVNGVTCLIDNGLGKPGVGKYWNGVNLTNMGIKNLKGIEHLYRIPNLTISNNQISGTVDLSNHRHLRNVKCNNNQIEHLYLCPADQQVSSNKMTEINCSNNKLQELDLTGRKDLTTLDYSGNPNLEKLILSGCTSLSLPTNYVYSEGKLKYLDLTGLNTIKTVNCKKGKLETLILKGLSQATTVDCDSNKLTTLDVTGCSSVKILRCNSNYLEQIDLSDCVSLENIECTNNLLKSFDLTNCLKVNRIMITGNLLDDIKIDHLKGLTKLIAHRNGLQDKDYDVKNHENMEQLQINGGWYKRDGVILREPALRVANVDVAHMLNLNMLLCQKEVLNKLDLSNNKKLTYVQLGRNRFLTLDLSPLPLDKTQPNTTRGQQSIEDLVVLDNDKVALYLPNGCDDIGRFGDTFNLFGEKIDKKNSKRTFELDTRDGKQYLIFLNSGNLAAFGLDKKDIDFKEKTISYLYNTKSKFESNDNGTSIQYMDVYLTVYPYIMYINPDTKSGNTDFYSGTIYLDYPAIIPEGTTAWIATGVKSAAETTDAFGNTGNYEQLILKKVADAGQAIPANTPVFIKADNKAGLYAFDKNWHPDYIGWPGENSSPSVTFDLSEKIVYNKNVTTVPVTIPDGNLLEGTLKDKTVSEGSVLTLGHERSTNEMGFWKFTNPDHKIGAHRCYIDASVLSSSNTRGVSFVFEE